jgi:replication initiation protein RepC
VSEQGKVLRLYPDELLTMAPRLRGYLGTDYASWRDVVEAADLLRSELDVSRALWGEACQTLGREKAAVAIAIVSAKDPDHFTRTPAHYFHGMIARAKRGELNLERTIWGLRSEKRQKAEQGRA